MRLLEPLQGIKCAQGHALVHLTFFTVMFFADTSLDTNLAKVKRPEDHSEVKHLMADDDYYFNLSHDTSSLSDKEKELAVFNFHKWGHLVCFLSIILSLAMKTREHYNSAQFV